MKLFRIMIEGRDDAGAFITTCLVGAGSLESARALLMEHASLSGWSVVEWEEEQDLGTPTLQTGVLEETGRAYFGTKTDSS
jgi:hypothetical protein